MALHPASSLVTWMPTRKRRAAKAGTFLQRHQPKPWQIALLVGFIIFNETRGLYVAVEILKAWSAS